MAAVPVTMQVMVYPPIAALCPIIIPNAKASVTASTRTKIVSVINFLLCKGLVALSTFATTVAVPASLAF